MVDPAPSFFRRPGLRHDLVGHLLTAIFKGEYPAGHRLVVKALAEQYGVSATPAREALLELTAIGMVDMFPNKGAIVRPFGPVELRGIYQVRRILEAEAALCDLFPARFGIGHFDAGRVLATPG